MQHCVTLYGEMRHCQWTPLAQRLAALQASCHT